MPGHLADGTEKGSQSYVPSDPRNDKALHVALDLLRGTKLGLYLPSIIRHQLEPEAATHGTCAQTHSPESPWE